MTEEPRPSADDADSRLVEKLARLRGIEPSPTAKATFDRLVEAELSAVGDARSTVWWRRSIPVPAPVCIAAAVAMLVLLFARLPHAADKANTVPRIAPSVSKTRPEPTRETTSTYMLGVGALATDTRYFSHEDEL